MPKNVPPELEDKFRRCKEKVMLDGMSEDSAYGVCYMSVVEGKGEAIQEAAKHGFYLSVADLDEINALKAGMSSAEMNEKIDRMSPAQCESMLEKMGVDAQGMNTAEMKSKLKEIAGDPEEHERMMRMMGMGATKSAAFWAVKAVGEWELDVVPVPFGSKNQADSDGQWFDSATDIMPEAFATPLVIYQHGIKQGGRALSDKPEIIGRSVPGSLNKQPDGWHIRVVLDKAKSAAKAIMDAAYKRAVAVSSDSISHLARLDIGGKLIQYEKNRPGRIAVWPLAGFSLWELGGGNFQPANRQAIALPAMKAMYREAGLVFPDVSDSSVTPGGSGANRAKNEQIRQQTIQYLKKVKEL